MPRGDLSSPVARALLRETALASEHLAIGATAVGRLQLDRPATYAQAFFALSVGLERTSKLLVSVDHALGADGVFPSGQELRVYGHDLRRLLDAVEGIVERRAFSLPHGQRPSTDIHDWIVEILGTFARNVTRYYNLDVLTGAERGTDPIATWYSEVTARVIERHVTDARKRKIEAEAAFAQAAYGPMTVARFVREDGQPVNTVFDMVKDGQLSEAARPWERMYVLQIARWLGDAVRALAREGQAGLANMPYLHEFFWIFDQEDARLRSLKVWGNER